MTPEGRNLAVEFGEDGGGEGVGGVDDFLGVKGTPRCVKSVGACLIGRVMGMGYGVINEERDGVPSLSSTTFSTTVLV